MEQAKDMRFDVVRAKVVVEEGQYELDGKLCPKCRMPTVVGTDVTRRYCENKMCNTFILGEL